MPYELESKYSLKKLIIIGDYLGVVKGDTRSLDYG